MRKSYGISVGGDIQGYDLITLNRDLDAISDLRAHWVRIDFNWAMIQDGGPTSYNWAPFDRVVQGIRARGMKVLGVIGWTPRWARPSGTQASYGPDPIKYGLFVKEIVEHYSPKGVHHYEIWNEPNVSAFWTPKPNPVAYTQLLRAAYPVIKSVDPNAKVLTGGTAPAYTDGTNYWPADWVAAIYANGGKGYFNAIAHHPYCFPAMPGDPEPWSSWYLTYASQPRYEYQGNHGGGPSIRKVMKDNGDGLKKIWGTEFGAPTNGPGYINEAEQAETIRRGYSLWENYDWAGPLFVYEARDYGTNPDDRENFFGLLRYDFSQKPAYSVYKG